MGPPFDVCYIKPLLSSIKMNKVSKRVPPNRNGLQLHYSCQTLFAANNFSRGQVLLQWMKFKRDTNKTRLDGMLAKYHRFHQKN